MSKLLSPIITGRVEGGKFVASNANLFRKAFWSHEGREVDVVVKRHRKNRSVNANAYYWGKVIPMIGEAIGESDAEAVHEMLKMEHNYYIKTVGKRELRVPLSTADLSTEDFQAYIDRVKRWGSEWLSLYIPDPGEAE